MPRDSDVQESQLNPSTGPKTPEIGGKHTLVGALTRTNYPGYSVPLYEQPQAEAQQKVIAALMSRKPHG